VIVEYNNENITVTQEEDHWKLEWSETVGYVYGREPRESDYQSLLDAEDATLNAEGALLAGD
jgi:hypothetical protein